MPMLAFLPWATTTESLTFGRFHIAPAGSVLSSGTVPAEQHSAVRVILQAYGRKRPVDQDPVPLIRLDGRGFTDDLDEGLIGEYFDFRTRAAFAVLASRRFFGHAYSNSDSVSLVIQGFVPERPEKALVQHRRRDGSLSTIMTGGSFSVPRPLHVGRCRFCADADAALLQALHVAEHARKAVWPALAEAMRLFVGANTDTRASGCMPNSSTW